MDQAGSFQGKDPLGRRRPSGLEINVLRYRSRARRAAKRARFEVCVRCRMAVMQSWVVMQMAGHPSRRGGTELQREWHAVRRHEAGGNIGTENQQGQQEDAGP